MTERMKGIAHLPGNMRCPKLTCNKMVTDHTLDPEEPGVYVLCDGARIRVVKYGGVQRKVADDPRIQRPR